MDILAKLFGSQTRVKIMRLFLLNSNYNFEFEEMSSRSRVSRPNLRKEINNLMKIDFIRNKIITKEGPRGGKKKVSVWRLNQSFQYLPAIEDLLVNPSILLQKNLASKFRPIGRIKLMIVSGVFIGEKESRADILLVCDKLKKTILKKVIKNLEVEIGKDLDYVVLNSEEFKYRIDMYDKLVCDVIDLPHIKLIDSGQLSTYISKKV